VLPLREGDSPALRLQSAAAAVLLPAPEAAARSAEVLCSVPCTLCLGLHTKPKIVQRA